LARRDRENYFGRSDRLLHSERKIFRSPGLILQQPKQ
jgi:hypothetical protein